MLSSAFLCVLLLYSVPAAAEPQNITVKPGQDASLQCRTHTENSIILVEWSRADLRSDDYVFFFREGRSYENYQLPSYRGRVQLRDPKMKDGDVSVVLKNVSFNDTGTYSCRVVVRLGEEPELISTINLTVKDSGEPAADEGGALHLVVICVSLVAVLLALLVLVVFIYFSRHRETKSRSYEPASGASGEMVT